MRTLLLALTAILGSTLPGSQTPAPAKLNVLFMVADDLNNDLGAYGAPVKTPHIDRLAERGVRFDRAYTQYPLCSPSRSSFLTGRRPDVTGVVTNPQANGSPMSPHFRERIPTTVTLPQVFKIQGWFSARIGKLYHYGVPNDIGTSSLDDYRSWDQVINPRGRDRDLLDRDRVFSLIPGAYGATLSWLADEGPDAEQTDGIAAVEAVRQLERFKKEGRAFFLAVGFYRPHTPYVAPKAYFDMYPASASLPAMSADDQARRPEAAYVSRRKEEEAMSDAQRREAIRAYYASTSFMDAQAGTVLAALDRLGLADSTVVVFTSDHGYHLGDHGLWQKTSLFERSARVPLIIAAPGAKGRGQAARGLVELVDLYPTLTDLAGVMKQPDYLDGVSLRPMLEDPTRSVKTAAYTQVRNGYSVRTERWRYIEWAEGERGVQLYDMERDPGETRNLAADPAHAATVAELKSLLQTYRRTGTREPRD